MVDFLDKAQVMDVSVLLWYVIFGIFFLWVAFTVIPTTNAAIASQNYLATMQNYAEFLATAILVFTAIYIVLLYFASHVTKHPNHKHTFPWLKPIYPTEHNVGITVISFLLVLCIIVITIYLRTTMLQFFGFYEPDGFYHFSVIRAAINNGFVVPAALSISGWPSAQPITESRGLYYTVMVPYAVLQYFGVSYYTIMRMVPVLFALLDMLGAYLLSRYMSKDKMFGILVIAFVGFSMGNAARTSALIFRGDTFVTFFLLAALILFIEMFRQESNNRKVAYAVGAGIALAMCNLVWDGAAFALATFMFSFILIVACAFVLRKEQLLNDSKYLLISLVVWYIVVLIACYLFHFISPTQFIDPSFIPILVAVAIMWGAAYYVTSIIPNMPILRTSAARLLLIAVAAVVGILLFMLVEPQIIYNVFVSNGFISAPGSFGTTIQELQPPTYQFLYTSFGINLFTNLPSALLMAIPTYFGFQNSIWLPVAGAVSVILLFIVFLPYFFMQIYDSGMFLSGNARVRFDLNIGMVIVMSFFMVTAYLQMHAIRFNSLISIPLAILSAYTIYWIIAMAMGAAKTPGVRLAIICIVAVFMIGFFWNLLANDNVYAQTLSQADSINPFFINSLQWLKANSPNNSVVLTLWPDGSVIEGVANRTSVTDSVGSQNGSKADPFAAWILNSSSDPQFLTSSLSGRPDYLLVRYPWLIETQGIYTESLITENASLFGYIPMQQFEEGVPNSTTRQLIFRNNAGYPYIVINIEQPPTNSLNSSAPPTQQKIFGYIQVSATQISPFQAIAFYNQGNSNYTYIPQTMYNSTNGELVLVSYSSTSKTNFYLNITGAYIMGPGLGSSNMIKFLYFCNSNECLWDNNQSTMSLVYQNPDTKIFKITYK